MVADHKLALSPFSTVSLNFMKLEAVHALHVPHGTICTLTLFHRPLLKSPENYSDEGRMVVYTTLARLGRFIKKKKIYLHKTVQLSKSIYSNLSLFKKICTLPLQVKTVHPNTQPID